LTFLFFCQPLLCDTLRLLLSRLRSYVDLHDALKQGWAALLHSYVVLDSRDRGESPIQYGPTPTTLLL